MPEVIQLPLTVWFEFFPEAEPETRVLGQVVYWKVIPRNTAGEQEVRQGRKPIEGVSLSK